MIEVRVYDAPSDLVGRWVREADMQALRAENARFRAVLMNMQAAWNNKNEVTSVYVWNERMKAAMADVDAALQLERGGAK